MVVEVVEVALPLSLLTPVEVVEVRQSNRPPRKIFDPHHPDANAEGYVSLPDINTMEEMVDMMSAARSYEANLSAFNTTLHPRLSEIF